jgi:hypothetical protein
MTVLEAFETYIIIYEVMHHNIIEDLNCQAETYLSKHPMKMKKNIFQSSLKSYIPVYFLVGLLQRCLDTQSILLNIFQITGFVQYTDRVPSNTSYNICT